MVLSSRWPPLPLARRRSELVRHRPHLLWEALLLLVRAQAHPRPRPTRRSRSSVSRSGHPHPSTAFALPRDRTRPDELRVWSRRKTRRAHTRPAPSRSASRVRQGRTRSPTQETRAQSEVTPTARWTDRLRKPLGTLSRAGWAVQEGRRARSSSAHRPPSSLKSQPGTTRIRNKQPRYINRLRSPPQPRPRNASPS